MLSFWRYIGYLGLVLLLAQQALVLALGAVATVEATVGREALRHQPNTPKQRRPDGPGQSSVVLTLKWPGSYGPQQPQPGVHHKIGN
jgi:hypothetical protein